MDDDRWSRVSSLFGAAFERDGEGRAALLDAAADPDLRREVESLLAAHEGTGRLDRLAAQMDGMRRAALVEASRDPSAASGGRRVPSAGLEPGQRLGRHEIRARLGAGGMGEVYRAFDTRLQREVAIKRWCLGRAVAVLRRAPRPHRGLGLGRSTSREASSPPTVAARTSGERSALGK